MDAIWYCRLLCGSNDKESKCDAQPKKSNGLPRLVKEREMELLIGIQIITLIACGANLTQIEFSGDKVGADMMMSETQKYGELNKWTMNSKIRSILPRT